MHTPGSSREVCVVRVFIVHLFLPSGDISHTCDVPCRPRMCILLVSCGRKTHLYVSNPWVSNVVASETVIVCVELIIHGSLNDPGYGFSYLFA